MEKLFAPELERTVISEILYQPKYFDSVRSILTPDSFGGSNRIIFESICEVYEAGKPIDSMSVYESLKKRNMLDDAGGFENISLLNTLAGSAEYIEAHAKDLSEKLMVRRLKLLESRFKNINERTDPFEKLDEITSEIYKIEHSIGSLEKDRNIFDEIPRLLDQVEKKYNGEIPEGLQCKSFPSLNRATGGIMSTDLVVIYGLEKGGKSFLSERLLLDFAEQNIPVGAFTMEMDFDAYSYRSLSMQGNINYLKLRNPRGNELTEPEFHEFHKRITKFKNKKFFVDDKTFEFERMLSRSKLWKRKHDIGILLFDYVGLIGSNKKFERRDLEIAHYTKNFKALAKEIETPVVIVSQANKEDTTADSKGALRDADFALRVSKPIEAGIKSIPNSRNETFVFTEDHFMVTVERSRYGKNKQTFICQFINNDFLEIDIDNQYI